MYFLILWNFITYLLVLPFLKECEVHAISWLFLIPNSYRYVFVLIVEMDNNLTIIKPINVLLISFSYKSYKSPNVLYFFGMITKIKHYTLIWFLINTSFMEESIFHTSLEYNIVAYLSLYFKVFVNSILILAPITEASILLPYHI